MKNFMSVSLFLFFWGVPAPLLGQESSTDAVSDAWLDSELASLPSNSSPWKREYFYKTLLNKKGSVFSAKQFIQVTKLLAPALASVKFWRPSTLSYQYEGRVLVERCLKFAGDNADRLTVKDIIDLASMHLPEDILPTREYLNNYKYEVLRSFLVSQKNRLTHSDIEVLTNDYPSFRDGQYQKEETIGRFAPTKVPLNVDSEDYISDDELKREAQKFQQALLQHEKSLDLALKLMTPSVRREASAHVAEQFPLRKINLEQIENIFLPMIFGSGVSNFPSGEYPYVWEYKEFLRQWIRANADSLSEGNILSLLGKLDREQGSKYFHEEIVSEFLDVHKGHIPPATLLYLADQDGYLVIPFLKRNMKFYAKEEALEIARRLRYVKSIDCGALSDRIARFAKSPSLPW